MTEVSSTRLYLGNLPRNGKLTALLLPMHVDSGAFEPAPMDLFPAPRQICRGPLSLEGPFSRSPPGGGGPSRLLTFDCYLSRFI
jgi:hypothetical protein